MSKPKKHKGIMPAFIYPPNGVSQIFMTAMHHSYRAGVFQHDYVAEIGSRPNEGRTKNGNAFLASDAEYIFLVDTDMAWEPQDIIKMRQFADEKDVKVLGGWALMTRNGLWPNAFRAAKEGYQPWGDIAPFGPPLKVDAVGGSCLLVHRDVYQDVYDAVTKIEPTAWPWQDDTYDPDLDTMMGEDISFCHRIRSYTEHEIWYYPDAIFTHIKPTPYGPKEYLRFMDGLRERVNGHLRSTYVQPTDQ